MNVVNINGRRIEVPNGSSISICGNVLYVDGKRWDEGSAEIADKQVIVKIDGDVGSLHVENGSADVNGNVHGSVRSGGSVSIGGYVTGDVSARGSLTCKDVKGNVDAGGSVSCGNIGGNLKAGGSVSGVGSCGNGPAMPDLPSIFSKMFQS